MIEGKAKLAGIIALLFIAGFLLLYLQSGSLIWGIFGGLVGFAGCIIGTIIGYYTN